MNITTPFSVEDITDVGHYIYTDDGAQQMLYIDNDSKGAPTNKVIGDLILSATSQFDGATITNRTAYKIYDKVLSKSQIENILGVSITIVNVSRALIDYTWSTQVNNGSMELVNSGASGSARDASMFSGEGILTDSTHYLDLTDLVSGATSMIFYKDGVATYTETLFYLFNDGTYKDLYYFSRSLTTTEQNQYSTDSNGFFEDVRDGIITGCVFNSPLNGTDKFIKDYQNYSIGNELAEITDPLSDNWTIGTGNASSSNGTVLTIDKGTGSYSNSLYRTGITALSGTTYLVKIKVISHTSNGSLRFRLGDINALDISDVGEFSTLATPGADGQIQFSTGGNDAYDVWTVDNVTVKEVTGMSVITGYDITARQNNLSYGSQEYSFLRDGDWRGNKSRYFEVASNVDGYANTGYTPSGTFQIEEVDTIGTTDTHRVYQSNNNKFTNGVADGTFTVPLNEIILNNSNIEGTTIDRYKLYKIYQNLNDPMALYNAYINSNSVEGIITHLKSLLATKDANWNMYEESPLRTYGTEYYVATDGSDSNDGSINSPFLTFEKARDTIRTNGVPANGVCVWVRGGTYYRNSTFTLNTSDKGTVSNPIHYRRYPNEKSVISGGQAIDPANFHQATSSDELYDRLDATAKSNIYVCDLGALGITDYGSIGIPDSTSSISNDMMELSVNGEIQTLARYPKANTNTESIPTIDDESITIISPDTNIAGTYTRTTYNPGNIYMWKKAGNNYYFKYTNIWYFQSDTGTVLGTDYTHPKSLPKQFQNTSGGSSVIKTITDDAIIQGFALSGNRPSSTTFEYYGNRADNWTIDDAYVSSMFTYNWSMSVNKITGIDSQTKTITVDTPFTAYSASDKNAFYYVWNIPEELTQQGEYYIDRTNGKLYIYGNPIGKSINVSINKTTLVEMDGSENIQFEGIELTDNRTLLVDIKTGTNNNFYKCKLSNSSAMLARIGNYQAVSNVWNSGFDYCELTGSGGTDLNIYGGNRKTLTNGNNGITNSKIHDSGRLGWISRGINVEGCGNIVSHNNIYNYLHQAIRFRGNEATIQYNNIYNVLLCASDAGAIYGGRSWAMRGNNINYNFIHDIKNYTGASSIQGIYFDDALSGNDVIGNIGDNISDVMFLSNGGRDITFKYNIAQNIELMYDGLQTGHTNINHTAGSSFNFLAQMNGVYDVSFNIESIDYTSNEWQTKYPELSLMPTGTDENDQWNNIVASTYLYPENINLTINATHLVNVYNKMVGTENGNRYTTLDANPVDVVDASFVLTDTSLIGPNV